MKKIKKMLLVIALCSIGAIAQHSAFNTSKKKYIHICDTHPICMYFFLLCRRSLFC